MKLILQRVKRAEVTVNHDVVGSIDAGLLIFLGVGKGDAEQNADTLLQKIIQLRVFEDDHGKMNLSAEDVGAQFLIVSQFTLYGDCQKGRRPSFDHAAPPKDAEKLYEYFVRQLKLKNFKVETGRFAATMDVELVNDGPVTLILENSN